MSVICVTHSLSSLNQEGYAEVEEAEDRINQDVQSVGLAQPAVKLEIPEVEIVCMCVGRGGGWVRKTSSGR